jgi:uncharacterized protein (DUF302 family)
MTTNSITIQRNTIESTKSFERVLDALAPAIGRPDMSVLQPRLMQAASFEEFSSMINGAVGSAGLMEFMRLDLGRALRMDPKVKAYKIVRIIAGNPLIMKQMVEHVPDAGSYAPVTILVYETTAGVNISYDTMESFIGPYGNAAALAVARDLDAKVMKLLEAAAA